MASGLFQTEEKHMSIPQRLTKLSMTAIVAVTVAACGTSSNQDTGPIKIGVEGPMTGQYADVGAGFWQGAQAAAREINAQGGLLGGRKLELVQADDVSDPADAVPAIRKLIDIDHIVALDGPNSTVLPAISPILVQNEIPTMFQGGTTHFDSNTVPWLWRPSPSDSQLGVAMAAYALTKGYKKAALVFASVASAQTLKGVVKDNRGGDDRDRADLVSLGGRNRRSEPPRRSSSADRPTNRGASVHQLQAGEQSLHPVYR
jgi:ABC-type branched-subunit amino acid transport system substrate-binding protein